MNLFKLQKVIFAFVVSMVLMSPIIGLTAEKASAAKKITPKVDFPKNPSEGVLIATIPWKAVTIMRGGKSSNDKLSLKNWSFDAIPLVVYLIKNNNGSVINLGSRSGPGFLRTDQKGNLFIFYGGSIFIYDIKNQTVKYNGDLLKKEGGSPVDLEMYTNGDISFLVRDNKSFGDDSVHYVRKNLKGDLINEKRVIPKIMAEHQLSKWTLSRGDIYYAKSGNTEKIDSISNLTEEEKDKIGNKIIESTETDLRNMRKTIEKDIFHLFIAPLHFVQEMKGSEYYWTNGVFDGRAEVDVVYIRNKKGNHKIYILPPESKFWRMVDENGNFYSKVDTPNALEVYKYVVNW